MPSLIWIDGFDHQTAQTAQTGSGFIGTYNTITTPGQFTFDTTNKRDGAASLKIVHTAATSALQNTITGTQILVGQFWIRVAANPSALSIFAYANGPTNGPRFQITTGGVIQALFTGGTAQGSTSVSNSAWHRVDFSILTNGTTYTLDWYLDGVAQTQATRTGQTATNMTSWAWGQPVTTGTLTCWIDDFVLSSTSGDFPLAPIKIVDLYPAADGTDNLAGGTAISSEDGTTTNKYLHIDDWNGGTPNTTDYVRVTTNAPTNTDYVEFTLSALPTANFVYSAKQYLAGFSSATSANQAELRLYNTTTSTQLAAQGTTDYSGSTTVLGYHVNMMDTATSWTVGDDVRLRWGFSGDGNPNPRISAAMVEIAYPNRFTKTNSVDVVLKGVRKVSQNPGVDSLILKTLRTDPNTKVDAYVILKITKTHSVTALIANLNLAVTPIVYNFDTGVDGVSISCPNLLPSLNIASVETDASGWLIAPSASGTIVGRSTAQAYAGSGSLEVQTASFGAAQFITLEGSGSAPVIAGQTYTASAYSRADAFTSGFIVRLYWYQGDTYLSKSLGATSTDSTSTWTRATVTAVAPANATYAAISVGYDEATAGRTHYIDAAQIELGSSASQYQDPRALTGFNSNIAPVKISSSNLKYSSTFSKTSPLSANLTTGTNEQIDWGVYYNLSDISFRGYFYLSSLPASTVTALYTILDYSLGITGSSSQTILSIASDGTTTFRGDNSVSYIISTGIWYRAEYCNMGTPTYSLFEGDSLIPVMVLSTSMASPVGHSFRFYDSGIYWDGIEINGGQYPPAPITKRTSQYVSLQQLKFSGLGFSIQGGSSGSGQGSQTAAQSFIATKNNIKSIALALTKTNSPTDNLSINITSTLGGSAIATSSSVDASTIPSGTKVFEFIFSSPPQLTVGNTYYMEIYRSGARDGSNYATVRAAGSSVYADGTVYTRTNNVWSSQTNDLYFIIISDTSHSVDALILAGATTNTITHSIEVDVQQTLIKTNSIDSLILKTLTKTQSVDSLILKAQIKTQNIDSLILKTQTIAQNVDSSIWKSLKNIYYVDAQITDIKRTLHQDFEAGSNGTSVTYENQAPDKFSSVFGSYSNAVVWRGNLSGYHFDGDWVYVTQLLNLGNDWKNTYFKAFVYFNAFDNFAILEDNSGGSIWLHANGTLEIQDRYNDVSSTTSSSLSTGVWYRLELSTEVLSVGGYDGTQTLSVYTGNSPTPTETIQNVNAVTRGDSISSTHHITWKPGVFGFDAYTDDVYWSVAPWKYVGIDSYLINRPSITNSVDALITQTQIKTSSVDAKISLKYIYDDFDNPSSPPDVSIVEGDNYFIDGEGWTPSNSTNNVYYSNDVVHKGRLVAKFTSLSSYLAYEKTSAFGTVTTEFWGRVYCYLPNPTTGNFIGVFTYEDDNATRHRYFVRYVDTNKFQITNRAGTVLSETTDTYPASKWIRVETHLVDNANNTADLTARIYIGESTTPAETISATNQTWDSGTTSYYEVWGNDTANDVFYIDSLAFSQNGWIGPDGSQSQKTHDVDALLSTPTGTQTKSTNIDALVAKTQTISNSVDARTLTSQMLLQAVDVLIRYTTTKISSADALIKKTATISNSADALIRKTMTVGGGVDALIKKAKTVSNSIDSLIKKRQTITSSVDSLLRQTRTQTQSVDVIISVTRNIWNSIDSFVSKTISSSTDLDVRIVKETLTTSFEGGTPGGYVSNSNHGGDRFWNVSGDAQFSTEAFYGSVGVDNNGSRLDFKWRFEDITNPYTTFSRSYFKVNNLPTYDTKLAWITEPVANDGWAVIYLDGNTGKFAIHFGYDPDEWIYSDFIVTPNQWVRIETKTEFLVEPFYDSGNTALTIRIYGDPYSTIYSEEIYINHNLLVNAANMAYLYGASSGPQFDFDSLGGGNTTDRIYADEFTWTSRGWLGPATPTRNTKHLVDSLISKKSSITTSVDSIILNTFAIASSEDAAILKIGTISNSVDVYIQQGSKTTQQIDALISKSQTIWNSQDALIIKSAIVSNSVDSLLNKQQAVSNSVDTLILKTQTTASSADALIQKGAIVSQQIDTLISKTQTVSQQTDALIRTTAIVSQQIDALIDKSQVVTQQADSLIRKSLTIQNQVESLLLKAQSVQQLVDADIRKTFIIYQSEDSLISKTQNVSQSVDVLVRNSYLVSQSVDSLIQKAYTNNSLVDSLLNKTQTITTAIDFDARKTLSTGGAVDALIGAGGYMFLSADALLKKTQTLSQSMDVGVSTAHYVSHQIDILVRETTIISSQIDSDIRKTQVVSQQIDSLIQKQLTIASSVDASILKTQAATHFADAAVLKIQHQTHSIDSLLSKSEIVSTAIDFDIKGAVTVSHSADALILRTQQISNSVDSLTRKTESTSSQIDANTRQTLYVSQLADALIQHYFTTSTQIDALIQRAEFVSSSAQSLIRKTITTSGDVDVLITSGTMLFGAVDALIGKTQTQASSVDALISIARTTSSSVDSLTMKTQSQTNGIDTDLRKTLTISHSVNALLDALGYKFFSADGLIQKTQTQTTSVDYLIAVARTKTQSVDALINKTQTKTTNADTLIKKTQAISQSQESLVRKTSIIISSADSLLVRTTTKSNNVDSLIKNQYRVTYDLTALTRKRQSVNTSIDALTTAGTRVFNQATALLLKTQSVSNSVDARLAIVQQYISTQVDAWVSTRLIKTQSVDAFIQKTSTTSTSVNALTLKTQMVSNAQDALIRQTYTISNLADSLILRKATVSSAIDSNLRKTLTKTYSVESLLGAGSEIYTAIDAIAFVRRTTDSQVDALILHPYTVVSSVDALLRRAQIVTSRLDAFVKQKKHIDGHPHAVEIGGPGTSTEQIYYPGTYDENFY